MDNQPSYTLANVIVEKVVEETYGRNQNPQVALFVTDGRDTWPNKFKVLFRGDARKWAATASVGDKVNLSFVLNGRLWDAPDGATKAFVDIIGFKVEIVEKKGTAPAPAQPAEPKQEELIPDDCPF